MESYINMNYIINQLKYKISQLISFVAKHILVPVFLRIFSLILLPMIIILLWVFVHEGQLIKNNAIFTNMQSLQQSRILINQMFNHGRQLCSNLYTNNTVEILINRKKSEYPTFKTILQRKELSDIISKGMDNYINEIFLYSPINNYVYSKDSAGYPIFYPDTNWIDYFNSNLSNETPFFTSVPSKDNNQIFYYYPLRKVGNCKRGFIAIHYSDDYFDELFKNTTGNQDIVLLNDENTIIYSTDKSWEQYNINDIWPDLPIDNQTPLSPRNYKNNQHKTSVISSISVPEFHLKYLSVVSSREYFSGQKSFRLIVSVVFFLCIILSLLCAQLLARTLYKPIPLVRTLLNSSSYSDDKNKNVDLKYILGGVYTPSWYRSQNNAKIITQISSLNKARLDMLQAQVNPHFLSNTLQIISFAFASETGNCDSTCLDLIDNLSSLIKENTQTSVNLITLHNELAYADKYLFLLKARYGESLSYETNCEATAANVYVPKMCLQPLIENSVKYSTSIPSGILEIRINCYIDNDFLIIDVYDNGNAMTDEKLRELNLRLEHSTSMTDNHIGLNNVNLRMKLIFGATSSMKLCKLSDGLCVELRIPTSSII